MDLRPNQAQHKLKQGNLVGVGVSVSELELN